jgi:hypothetical protein
MFWVTTIYGVGYVFYWTFGPPTYSMNSFYTKLLLRHIYFPHLIVNIIIAIVGYYRCKNINMKEVFIFAPLIFLTILPLINWTVRLLTNRNLIIATRWDKKPRNYKWLIDFPASIMLFAVPLISCGLIVNKFRFGHFFV